MNNYSNSKKILSVLFITSTLCCNLVAMEGAVAPEAPAAEQPVAPAEGPGNGVGLEAAEALDLLAQLFLHRYVSEKDLESLPLIQRAMVRERIDSKGFLKTLYYGLPSSKVIGLSGLGLIGTVGGGIIVKELLEPAVKGMVKPGSSFFLKLLKKLCSVLRIPFKDGKRAEAEEINEREGALDIKRRGLESDRKLLNDMRGMLNKKDSDYQEQLNEIKDLEERHRKNVKEYFELRKELNKKETEYKVVAVEKYVSPQQAAAALAAAA